MKKQKIVVFSGAGISKASGIDTFRGSDGLYNNYNIDDVVTIEGWNKNPQLVLDFHNELRRLIKDKQPNEAHLSLVKLEEYFEVIHVTQNIDDLFEKAGATNILHLHGQLNKCRSTEDNYELYDCNEDINLGDACNAGYQLRPFTVLFGEYPYYVEDAYRAMMTCDHLLIVGTSLNISYTLNMIKSVNKMTTVYYIDPQPSEVLNYSLPNIIYCRQPAEVALPLLVDSLIKSQQHPLTLTEN